MTIQRFGPRQKTPFKKLFFKIIHIASNYNAHFPPFLGNPLVHMGLKTNALTISPAQHAWG